MIESARDKIDIWKSALGIKTDADFRDIIEATRPAMDKWISRNSIPSWVEKKINNVCKSMQTNKQEDTINLHYYNNVVASAGYGSQNTNENFSLVPVSPEFLDKILKVPVKNYDIIRVFGDSMEPFAENGDLVIVDRSAEVKNGDIIIANICGDIYIKKILRDPIKQIIKLTSLNTFYQDIEITKEEAENLQIVGKVRCKFSINMKIY